MIALWIGLVTAHAGCDEMLGLALNQAERAFLAEDRAALADAVSRVRDNLECVRDAIDPTRSARIHRAEALLAYQRGNRGVTELALRGMVRADPWLGLHGMVDGSHPLSRVLEAAEEAEGGDSKPLTSPETGTLRVDGLDAVRMPAERPFVYQQIRDGEVVFSTRVHSGAAPPALVDSAGRVRRGGGGGLTVAGLGVGVAAGALYGAAWSQRARYDRSVEAGDNAAIESAYRTTNALSIGSVVAAGVGTGLLTVGIAI